MDENEFRSEIESIRKSIELIREQMSDFVYEVEDKLCGILNELDGKYAKWEESDEGYILDGMSPQEIIDIKAWFRNNGTHG